MTNALHRRLMALESLDKENHAKPLTQVVPDGTADTELARLRQHGREVFRESDTAFIHLFV